MNCRNLSRFLVLSILSPVLMSVISCTGKVESGSVIMTLTNTPSENASYFTGESWRYPEAASLVAFNTEKPGRPVKLLTGDFSSARSPEISYDGRSMIFTAKLGKDDPWQIYEMNLSSLKYRRITDTRDNCTDPAYLPGNRVVFSKTAGNDTTGITHNLFTVNIDGSDLRQVTYHPHADFAPAVLADGRVLWITRQVFPSEGRSAMYIMRPDGTKADMFFGCTDGNSFISKACENNKKSIYFIEKENGKLNSGALYSVSYNRPLYTKRKISGQGQGSCLFVSVTEAGDLFMAYKPSDSDRYGLYSFNPEGSDEPALIYSNPDHSILEIAIAGVHERPKKLPSEVDLKVQTGQIMCQDINVLGAETSKNNTRAMRIEILGTGGSIGIVEASEDGSFYLKPLANMPFRIRTIDESGKVLNGPSGWMWMRPNERRGCVGCHEDPELVPVNRIPLAVKSKPVKIPADAKIVKDKSVELE